MLPDVQGTFLGEKTHPGLTGLNPNCPSLTPSPPNTQTFSSFILLSALIGWIIGLRSSHVQCVFGLVIRSYQVWCQQWGISIFFVQEEEVCTKLHALFRPQAWSSAITLRGHKEISKIRIWDARICTCMLIHDGRIEVGRDNDGPGAELG